MAPTPRTLALLRAAQCADDTAARSRDTCACKVKTLLAREMSIAAPISWKELVLIPNPLVSEF